MEGTPFGRYRLVESVGRGGLGEVWRAHDTDTDRIVAIKVLPAHFSDNEEFRRRFRGEAHAAARLTTPHAIPIHTYGEIGGRPVRLIEDRGLGGVPAEGPLELGRAVRVIEGVALLHFASSWQALAALNSPRAVDKIILGLQHGTVELHGSAFVLLWFYGLTRKFVKLGRQDGPRHRIPDAYTAHDSVACGAETVLIEPAVLRLDPA